MSGFTDSIAKVPEVLRGWNPCPKVFYSLLSYHAYNVFLFYTFLMQFWLTSDSLDKFHIHKISGGFLGNSEFIKNKLN